MTTDLRLTKRYLGKNFTLHYKVFSVSAASVANS